MFQIDPTHELYAHKNINYVRVPKLPDFDHSSEILCAMAKGEFFISTGEVLMPEHTIRETKPGVLHVTADVHNTLPLQFAELVWGNGNATFRKIYPLDSSRQFSEQKIAFDVDAKGWQWARLAVWDVAGNGAFANPVRLSAK